MIKIVLTQENNQVRWDELQNQLKIDTSRNIEWLLDMSKLSFIDSLSLGNLLATNGQLVQRGCRLKLIVRKGTVVEKLLMNAKFDRIMPINIV